jgi:uncharacterized protein (DUF1800 family)
MRIKVLVSWLTPLLASIPLFASDTPPPVINGFTISNTVKSFTFGPVPAIDQYAIKSGSNITALTTNGGGVLNLSNSPFTYRATNSQPVNFYTIQATPMSSNALLTANVLNRLAYGPTPDELVRVASIGPQAYIDEQLAPEAISEVLDAYTSQTTNGVPPSGAPEWQFVSYTGTVSSARLYLYLTAAGDAYVDDIALQLITTNVFNCVPVTNVVNGTNVVSTNCMTNWVIQAANNVQNGDFEAAPLPGTGYPPMWTVSLVNMGNSHVTNGLAHSGNQSLHVVATSAGSSETTSIWQDTTNSPSGHRCVLSFWYLPSANSANILSRLSGSGVIALGNNAPPTPTWIYATATGQGNTTGGPLYIYLSGAGECFVDDLKLVRGTVAEAGSNLVVNGDFETLPLTNSWSLNSAVSNSYISTDISHSGAGSLKVIATSGGGSGQSVFQNVVGVTNNGTYTVSFWYLPPDRYRTLTVRLSGSRLVAAPEETLAGIKRRLDGIGGTDVETGARDKNSLGGAFLADLRAWFTMNAVNSKRQLLEILTQFLENHFVTQHAKSRDYFDRTYDDGNLFDIFSTDWEYREISKWRAALMNTNCTFYDLLKIHVESPAEIVYLDSVDSRGNGNNIANENYAREIQELFCMGVDNGYDQQDITVMSRAWTGWSVELVDPQNINNPFAPAATRIGFYPNNGTSGKSNIVGVWAFNYKAGNHGTNRAPIWSVWNPSSPATNPQPTGPKLVPARFGAPWAGTSYQLSIPRRVTGDTNSIQDGYDVTTAIANLPFTMEYISVKLCRLFVHDDFVHGVYDYTDPNRSAEAELIRQCMVAWNTAAADGRKGNMRSVLRTIFNSDLFRSHGGSLQKVKTPLEFAASAIRALRSDNGNGTFTASTDGYSISGRSITASSAPLTRMGTMMLFDRDAPDGYPEAGPPWISAGTLAERVRFIQTFLMTTNDTRKGDGISGGNFNNVFLTQLIQNKIASGSWNDANAVASYFVSILYPGEGLANLTAYRQIAVAFLNTADAGTSVSNFSGLGGPGSANYDNRVRAMVAMLMTLQRFQEQ